MSCPEKVWKNGVRKINHWPLYKWPVDSIGRLSAKGHQAAKGYGRVHDKRTRLDTWPASLSGDRQYQETEVETRAGDRKETAKRHSVRRLHARFFTQRHRPQKTEERSYMIWSVGSYRLTYRIITTNRWKGRGLPKTITRSRAVTFICPKADKTSWLKIHALYSKKAKVRWGTNSQKIYPTPVDERDEGFIVLWRSIWQIPQRYL